MSDDVQQIVMPQMGVSVEEGVVTAWHKALGDTVVAEEAVCEVATDKVDTEVVAPAAGVLAQIVVGVGETVAVGAPLALLAPFGADLEAIEALGSEQDPNVNVAPASDAIELDSPATDRPTANVTTEPRPMDFAREAAAVLPVVTPRGPAISPVARRIAAEHGLDVGSITGTGMRGRIRKADVLRAIAEADRPLRNTPSRTPGGSVDRVEGGLPPGYADVPHRIVSVSPTRRAIAEHMSRSRRTAAHMTTEVEVDMHLVGTIRAALNTSRLADGLPKLSYLPFVARAACSALADYPDLNATFDGDRLIQWQEVNLSVAVDTDRGLLAPVIRGCGRLNVGAIAERIAGVAARARASALRAADFEAGTFTISNPGSVGAVSAMAIINQPQVAILGMPAIVKRPTVITTADGSEVIAIRPVMTMAITFDHRALDGADATRCAVAIKERLETWNADAYA